MYPSVSLERLEARRLLAAQSPAWSDVIDNPYMPLIPGTTYVYKGVLEGQPETNRTIVTDDIKVVQGVNCTVVLDRVFAGGVLVEKTYDFYAQDKAGNVWYFGEDTKEFENGKVSSREGSFLAGVNGAKAGIIMLAQPNTGDAYFEEFSKGVAEDQAKVLATQQRAKTPFATFNNCLETENFTLLEPDALEHKLYAKGIGVVFSQDISGGQDTLKLVSIDMAPESFATTIDNPLMPLIPGTRYTYKGVLDGEAEKVRTIVTKDTKVVMGVTTTLVLDRVFSAGELIEKTYDFYAQDKVGNVWYFGENTKEFENGKVVSREGSFEAGVNGARAGIIMLAHPGVGDAYHEEFATAVAEDQAKVIATQQRAKTPFATFNNCLETDNFTLLEPGALEHKLYAPGFGVVFSEDLSGGQDVLRLVSVEFA